MSVDLFSDGDSGPVSGPASSVHYFWIITFHWDIHVKDPFQITPLSGFKVDEIPEEWIVGSLSEFREHQILCSTLGEGYFSVFAKIEKGERC